MHHRPDTKKPPWLEAECHGGFETGDKGPERGDKAFVQSEAAGDEPLSDRGVIRRR